MEASFDPIIKHFETELKSINLDRPSVDFLSNVTVESHALGRVALKEVASVSLEGNSFVINVWNKSLVHDIKHAISQYDSGLNPYLSGNSLKAPIPKITAETKEEMIKIVNEKKNLTKVKIKNKRQDLKTQIQNSDLSEDVEKVEQKKLDKIVADYNSKIEEMADKKIENIKNK